MGLSDYDKKVLEQLERDLVGDASFAAKTASNRGRPSNSAAKLIAGALVALIGMSLLVFSAIVHLVVFGVAGFVVALAGIVVASASAGGKLPNRSNKTQNAPKNRSSYFEDRWEKRKNLD